jgi:hypothetical protein
MQGMIVLTCPDVRSLHRKLSADKSFSLTGTMWVDPYINSDVALVESLRLLH